MGKEDMPKKKCTIYDIAKEAQVSAATVSRVLSKSSYPVSKELREKILIIAREMDYFPNLVGRMLKKSESKDIGVIIPNISNPFYPQLVLGIELEAKKHGFNILLCNSFRDVEREKEYIESMFQRQVRGIILSTIREQHNFLKDLCRKGLKVVGFDQNIDDLLGSKISFDFYGGGLMAVDYLVKMGHKKIAFASSPLTRKSRKEIFEGYKMGLIKNGLNLLDKYLYITDMEEEVENGTYEFESGEEMAQRWILAEDKPTAIFAVNDITAIGIIRKLINEGVKVPEDVSIIGFDNIEFSTMINPPLTTINQPAFDTGRIACNVLIEDILEDRREFISIKLEPGLVERDSVRALE